MKCFIIDTDELNDDTLFNDCLSVLPHERQEKVRSFVFMKDRRLGIAAGLFIEYIRRTSDTEIVLGTNDKPISANGSVEFNISHSGHYAVCAISDEPIGIDIEMIGNNDDITDTVMTEDEKNYYLAHPIESRNELFCRMWTAKESYMKAIGSGLTLDPRSFAVIGPDGIGKDSLPGPYNLYEPAAPNGYRVSICSNESSYSELKAVTCSEIYRCILDRTPL